MSCEAAALLAAALLCAPPAADDDELSQAELYNRPRGGVVSWISHDGWVHVPVAGGTDYVLVDETTRIVWAYDRRVVLPYAEIRPGQRVRYQCPGGGRAAWIEVACLGPLAMEAAVERWVAEAAGGRAWVALSSDELALVDQLGAGCYQQREAATRALRDRGPGALRPLIWATRHTDPEVRCRAGVLLAELGWQG